VLGALGDAFESAGIAVGKVGRGALDERVSLLSVEDAKGLEFDAVTVVEPDRIARESAQGLRSLYVALTRATQWLTVVHSGSLPAALAAAQPSSA
jgi:superfamily I DNA/RNA helicase